MKITSNFKDYYDSQRALDRDEDPLYVRVTSTPSQRSDLDSVLKAYLFPWSSYYESGVIGFCGRVYPFISIGAGKNRFTAYSLAGAISMIKAWEPGERYSLLADNKDVVISALTTRQYYYRSNPFQPVDWDNTLARGPICISDKIFQYYKAPALMMLRCRAKPHTLIVNPRLNEYDLVKVLAPPTAYQELSMYLGNNLADVDRVEPRPITDAERASTKGYDKQSFRNQKNRKSSDRSTW